MQKNDMSVLSVLSVWRFIDQFTRQIEQIRKLTKLTKLTVQIFTIYQFYATYAVYASEKKNNMSKTNAQICVCREKREIFCIFLSKNLHISNICITFAAEMKSY